MLSAVTRLSTTKELSLFLILLLHLPRCVVATWWYLSQIPLHSVSLVGTGLICDHIPGLDHRQRQLCRVHPDVIVSVADGASLGVKECQSQFKMDRWNCSTSSRDSSVFGKVMLKVGSREAAFVYAISSAGVVHAITRACSRGSLHNCACDPTKRGTNRDAKGIFDWGGCSDNVRYGAKFARRFVDAKEKSMSDPRALMNIHNNRAGRRAVKKLTKLVCKCHGVSGSCTIRTCWQAVHDFKHVGDYLRHRYNGATQVTTNSDGSGLIVANRNHKRPTKSDIVYFDKSPDYCVEDSRLGSFGTEGRECNGTSLGPDGCDIMCCGHGYNEHTVKRIRKCDCVFHWCCHVTCNECEEWVTVNTCRGPNQDSGTNLFRKSRSRTRHKLL